MQVVCVVSEGSGSPGRGHFYWAIMQRLRWLGQDFSKRLKTAEQKIAKRWRRRINTPVLFEEDPPEEHGRGPFAPQGARRNETEDYLSRVKLPYVNIKKKKKLMKGGGGLGGC